MNSNSLQLAIRRAAKIECARRFFWDHCKLVSPDFYKEDRLHLKKICDSLQALYEGRIIKYRLDSEWIIADCIRDVLPNAIVCKKLMLNIPPQHGKSRTLINFVTWLFGKNSKEKVITASYNNDTASDFSRYTRDAIDSKSIAEYDIVYSDIFPKTKIKKGNAGFEKWALDGSHFSYIGVGIGGSVTSKGGSVLIVDDPIKSAEDALNENNLERIWLWYTSTFLSRVSADQGEPIEIICMTRWSDKDICGRILENTNTGRFDWFIIKMAAYDELTDTMLCSSLFSRKRYLDMESLTLPMIFKANYKQIPGSKTGALFQDGDLQFFQMQDLKKANQEAILGYIDVADEGDDNLSFPLAYVFPNKIFITDIVFTQDGIDLSLPACVSVLKDQELYDEKKILIRQFDYVRVEANNQGGGFIRDLRAFVGVDRVLAVKNTTNKNTRILMQYGFIKKYFYFRNDYAPNSDYARFMAQLGAYMKDGSSKKDDAPDSIAGLSKFIRSLPATCNLFTDIV